MEDVSDEGLSVERQEGGEGVKASGRSALSGSQRASWAREAGYMHPSGGADPYYRHHDHVQSTNPLSPRLNTRCRQPGHPLVVSCLTGGRQ